MNTNAAVVLRRILERSNPCGAGSRDGILESRDEDDEDLVEKTKYEVIGKREWFDERRVISLSRFSNSACATRPRSLKVKVHEFLFFYI